MPERYEPKSFEDKWRKRWREADLFHTREEPGRPKFYGLEFFPYPSGAGLSVGHCRNYVPSDVICRFKTMQGFNVLHPMGFDAFGLPAENEAIARKTHPAALVKAYGANYRRQLDLIGSSYDWSRLFYSSDPDYYHWTQWIFELLYKKGLAYRKLASVNWCPKDKTVLADEEVEGGLCWRCGTPVEKKWVPQWFFKITAYADRLLEDLHTIDWPEGIKEQQRNWIGRSEGVEFSLKVDLQKSDKALNFSVFTTRIDTVFGMTFCVLAPEHDLVNELIKIGEQSHTESVRHQIEKLKEYRDQAKRLTETDRLATNREKTGVFTGFSASNPVNGERVPIWVADYVLASYGTGAIMAVPGHDERDFEFAQKFGLPVVPVIAPEKPKSGESTPKTPEEYAERYGISLPTTSKDWFMINSGEYSGSTVIEGQESLAQQFEAHGIGERKVTYRLRDWLISRQRYWGCPIPIVYDKEGEEMLVPENLLPVELPKVDKYEPGEEGQSPLAAIQDFVNVTCPDGGGLCRRETDTMGGFACSSWYFLRFCDPHNSERAWDPEKVKAWMPVDCYVGGAEHAVMHLLYARFWTKVLYDAGIVSVKEPFQKLMNQGQVLAKTPYRKPREGEKLEPGEEGILMSFDQAGKISPDELIWRWARMSKSKGNVVTPDEMVEQYGADALRIYELFVAPFEADVQWSNEGVAGGAKFLNRVFRQVHELTPFIVSDWRNRIGGVIFNDEQAELRRFTHQKTKIATEDIERFAFNTYVAELMKLLNKIGELTKDAVAKSSSAEMSVEWKLAISEALESYILLLAPSAPFSADELWESIGKQGFTYNQAWPRYDPAIAKDVTVTIAVQVNGKLRDTLEMPADASEQELQDAALGSPKVKAHLDGKAVKKVIVVPGKLVNVVVA